MGKNNNNNKKGNAFVREMTGSAPLVNLDGNSDYTAHNTNPPVQDKSLPDKKLPNK